MKILVTGCAGFIGFHLTSSLIKKKFSVFGIDNLNDYYDVTLKKHRLKELKQSNNFIFKKIDISDQLKVKKIFKDNKFDIVYHLAAQAGVRDSVINPQKYFKDNIQSFFNIIECIRINKISHFVFASSSSVYGNNKKLPYLESLNINSPESFYAASKASNEIMARSYSKVYNIKMTGLRFFTVYGPSGRPDMALYKFTTNILKNKKITVYNYGKHKRDFIYVSDVVTFLENIIAKKGQNRNKFEIYNVGNNKTVKLKNFITVIGKLLNKKPKIKFVKKQLGDVEDTHSNSNKAFLHYNFRPKVKLDDGIENFIKWYKKYNQISNDK